jgi:hypothetical protein
MKQVFDILAKKLSEKIYYICCASLLSKIFICSMFGLYLKRFTTVLLAFVTCYTIGFEVSAQPNPINIESVNLYKHGTNSSDVVGPLAAEATDSVAVGSTSKYYSMPDTVVNGSFKYSVDPYANVSSTFTWTVTPALSTLGVVAVPAHNTALHYRQITWTSTGSGNIQVTERSSAGCNGTTITTPVTVIALPVVQFSSTASSDCRTDPEGAINYSLTGIPVSWTSSVSGKRQLKVNITISCTNTGFGVLQTHNNITITETGSGTGTIDLPVALNYYGLYTITLTSVNDRISVKSGMNGTVGASASYTFVISKNPDSNPVYHVPNN